MGPWRPFEDFQGQNPDFWRILKSSFLSHQRAKKPFFTTHNHDLAWNLMSRKIKKISAKSYFVNLLSPLVTLYWSKSGFAPNKFWKKNFPPRPLGIGIQNSQSPERRFLSFSGYLKIRVFNMGFWLFHCYFLNNTDSKHLVGSGTAPTRNPRLHRANMMHLVWKLVKRLVLGWFWPLEYGCDVQFYPLFCYFCSNFETKDILLVKIHVLLATFINIRYDIR